MEQAFTVLFVEDEADIRNSVAWILKLRGLVVLTASDGYEAMRILAQRHVDVLFTDIVMPGINGIELAKQAKLLHPHLRIMFATGYAARAHDAMALGRLLFKPLRAAEIDVEVRSLMASH